MPEQNSTRTLWNEGRVVGLSAYEVYVKQHQLVEDPTIHPPASEREWLSSSLATGASLLVHVTKSPAGIKDEDNHVLQISLPDDTKLCAANTIVASFFHGYADEIPGTNFATRVTSYGQLVNNTKTSSPSAGHQDAVNLPYQNPPAEIPDDVLSQMSGYMRIIDGVVLQSGNWKDSGMVVPAKDFEPDESTLSTAPILRLLVKGVIDTDFWMLLSGFTMRSVLQGETKLEGGALRTDNPADGDFLGPQVYPWANKIVFTVPTAAIRYDSLYARTIASGTQRTLQDSAVIDMRDTDPATYYASKHSSSRVDLDVNKFVTMRDNTAVLTVYQRNAKFSPALYGTFVTKTGSQYLNPIDVVAPRTVKFFHGEGWETAKDFEAAIPTNFAIIRDKNNYKLTQIGPKETEIPVADATVVKSNSIYRTTHTHGTHTVKSIAITDNTGKDLPITGTAGSIEIDDITWTNLLTALGLNKKIDVLGSLKVFKAVLDKFLIEGNPGEQYVIEVTEDGNIQLVEFDAVHAEIENRGTAADPIYIQKMTIGGESDFRTIAIQDLSGRLLNMTGSAGVLSQTIDSDGVSWQHMLNALATNKKIDAVGPTLTGWRNALLGADGADVYSVSIDSNGRPTLVKTAKFPDFIRETVRLVPVADSSGKNIYDKMVLDIFGYTTKVGGQTAANMICTITCIEGSLLIRDAFGFKQRFKVHTSDINAWLKIQNYLANIAGIKMSKDDNGNLKPLSEDSYDEAKSIAFTSPGRPIYTTTKGAAFHGFPWNIIMISGFFSFDGTKGVLYGSTVGRSKNWIASTVSSAAYEGGLVISDTDLRGKWSSITTGGVSSV